MNKSERLEALILHYAKGSDIDFAKLIGINKSTLASWKHRNSYDADLLYQKLDGVSGDWLLSGEGAMIKEKPKEADGLLPDYIRASFKKLEIEMADIRNRIDKKEAKQK